MTYIAYTIKITFDDDDDDDDKTRSSVCLRKYYIMYYTFIQAIYKLLSSCYLSGTLHYIVLTMYNANTRCITRITPSNGIIYNLER